MTRGRFILTAGAVCILLLASSATDAQGVVRGIYFQVGEKLVTELSPAGDVDTYVFYGVRGVQVSLTLAPTSAGFSPRMDLLGANGASLGAPFESKGGKLKLRSYELPATGAYFIRVDDPLGRAGSYELSTKGNLRKAPPFGAVTIGPGETHAFVYAAGPDVDVQFRLKATDRKKPFTVLSVTDPDGEEVPHAAQSFVKTTKDLRALVAMRSSARSSYRDSSDARRFGDYSLVVGGATSETTIQVKVKVKFPKVNGVRVLSPDVPMVDEVDPGAGRTGTKVTIRGSRFQPGTLRVLFGGADGKGVTFVSTTEIAAVAPYGEGEVDVTVINPDGQEGVLEKGFIFIPLPPNIGVVTPVEGPDSGGTVVHVYGERMRYVEKVSLGSTVMTGSPVVVTDSHLQFTTDALAPGTYDLTLTDQFDQSTKLAGAFTLIPPPLLTSLSPSEGSFAGNETITCVGQNFRPDHQIYLDGTAVTTSYGGTGAVRFTTPPGPVGKQLDVAVRDIWGRQSLLAKAFTYRDGWFRDVTSARMPANPDTKVVLGGTAVALGDVDKDDDLDVVVSRTGTSNGSPQTAVLHNDGSGTFTDSSAMPKSPVSGDDFQGQGVALGDLDDDGDLDLVVTTDAKFALGSVSWRSYTYWSTKTMWYWKSYSYRASNVPYASTRVLLNDGTGSFSLAKAAFTDPKSAKGTDTMLGNAVAIGDLDDDGDLDLVVAKSGQVETSTYTESRKSYYWSSYWNKRWYLSYWISVSRSFSQGKVSDRPATRVLLNDGKASFADESSKRLPSVKNGDLFAADAALLRDLDGNKSLDLVLTGDGSVLRDAKAPEYVAGSKTRILTNDGKGFFTNKTSSLFPATKSGDDWGGVALAMLDLDGDGRPDLVVTTAAELKTASDVYLPCTRLFLNRTTGFSDATANLPSVRSDGKGEMLRAVSVVLANVNSHPAPDIVIVDEAVVLEQDPVSGLFTRQVSSTRILRNDGTGKFTNDTEKGIQGLGTDKMLGSAVALGDLDGDTDLDLVVTTDLPAYTGTGKRPTRELEFR